MPRERTSRRAARSAARTLRSRTASKDAKSAAGSALTQKETETCWVKVQRVPAGEIVSVFVRGGLTFSYTADRVEIDDRRRRRNPR